MKKFQRKIYLLANLDEEFCRQGGCLLKFLKALFLKNETIFNLQILIVKSSEQYIGTRMECHMSQSISAYMTASMEKTEIRKENNREKKIG